ncbi:isochorismate synthase [Marmoricola endophyticus]|uniref:isochorismate synthase n=1 Tax=Marmoricola endophyticus TaxID=2040280 RepID=A0A917BMR0_9ACTN|nr:isochorismate synthase [Marmoricola endophyticus]GGF50889.1 isochorismate synthase [Marmoricola endophyticus]
MTPAPPRLVSRTVEIPDPGALLDRLPDTDSFVWLRDGEGLVGWGRAAQCDAAGEDRFLDASDWWRGVVAAADVADEVRVPGSGLVCFGGFGFSGDPGDSVLAVPRVVVGRRHGVAWLTTTAPEGESAALPDLVTAYDLPAAPVGLTTAQGALSDEEWTAAVADAVARIGAGDLEKVVLARDVVATAAAPVDVRWPLRRLARDYRRCWTFHVDGWFGATPEMLVRRERGLVTSRVLAGTIRRTGDDEHDLALAATLARSSKDLEEHEYAVRSVADALAPYCDSMNLPDAPFVLHLPNVMHLATDVAAVVHDTGAGANALELAAALHPSAAVGGTPTKAAVRLISEVEGMDRGRYAAPVGWMDGSGDGEYGIALRSAHLDGATVRLFAGCGIVADSDPSAELAESEAKLVPVRDALRGE